MTITGTLERIAFRNEETAWSAVLMKTDKGIVRATGIMPALRLGMTLRLTGEMQATRYGDSLKADECTEVRPSDKEGIEKYLASGLIRDIGPKLAKDVVKVFGEDTLRVLDEEPERLKEVHGIGKKRIASISAAVKEQKDIRSIMIWLKRYDLTNGLAAKIFTTYGHESLQRLEENPYRLSDDIRGVGFHKADEVARRIGIEPHSRFRIESGLKACLENWAGEGNTYMERDELIRRTASPEYLSIGEESVAKVVHEGGTGLITEGTKVFLPYLYHAENTIAGRLAELLSTIGWSVDPASAPDITALETETGVRYSQEQRIAIETALLRPVSVITGGPGTGKTVTTNAIIRELERSGDTVLLTAPTGRAAKRMNEVTGREAKTIHRLLGFQQGQFTVNEDAPLEGDALIVDEASMIDAPLMSHLLEAVPTGMRVVLVGDVDQLPSVGPGCVLRDIIDSGAVPTTRLTEIYRQAGDSDIILNAHAVNAGRPPRTDNHPGTDFWFFNAGDRETVASLVVDLVARRAPAKFGCRMEDIQVLSPMRREGDCIGSTELSRRLQQVINPAGEPVATKGGTEFRVGDRIMQTKNDYDKGVFNGDTGLILTKEDEKDEKKTLFTADFDGETVRMSRADVNNIELAYACTVHKSQGSEYPVVVMPVHESHYIMLKRNLLYTGITRAKRQCILVGTRKAAAIAAANEDTRKRFTSLKERLCTKN